MLKERLLSLRRSLVEGFVRTLYRYPVELLLLLFACVGCVVMYESDSDFSSPWGLRVILVPFFLMMAFTVNQLAGQSIWRRVYWVCWLPIVPLALWSGLETLVCSISFTITTAVLAPVALLASRRAVDNNRFVSDAVGYLRAGAIGGSVCTLIFALFCAILFSTAYIFGIQGDWTERTAVYVLILCEVLGAPLLLLMMVDRRPDSPVRGMRILGRVVDYAVMPALLIYMAVLYLYIAKIILTWSLPLGGVAYLVLCFTMIALIVKALREIVPATSCEWFYRRFSLFALPPALLFCVGVVRRVDEYGLTPSRVWLIVCGVVMTICLLLFLHRRTGRYLYATLALFICFALPAYIPCLHPEQLSLHSQVARAEQAAARMGIVADDGHLQLHLLANADSENLDDYKILYETLKYIDRADSVSFSRFGLKDMDEFRTAIPVELRAEVISGRWGKSSMQMFFVSRGSSDGISVAGYDTLYELPAQDQDDAWQVSYNLERDTLHIRFGGGRPAFAIARSELLRTQLRRAGLDTHALYSQDQLNAHANAFLTYTDERLMILFSEARLCVEDEQMYIDWLSIDAILVR